MLLLSLAMLVGCVPKKKYLELESQLADTRAQLASDVASRDATIADLRGEAARMGADIKRLTAAIEGKEKVLAELRTKNASMLKDKGALTEEIEAMQAALTELAQRKAAADARLREFRELLERFETLIDAGTLQVKIADGRMVVAMATDVLFDSGSATLSTDGKEALTEVATILASIPDREFQVEGHTDDDPIATAQFPSNWFLASRRSLNVVQHMLDSGMPADRISGASYGEFRPIAANDTDENKALNRRIEIVVVPDLSQLPGYDELQAIAR